MKLLVDRLPSVDYDDRLHGEKFVITFRWGDEPGMVPAEVVTLYKYQGEILVAGTQKRDWNTYDEAVEAGKVIADRFVAKYWKD
ncbi:hypothetical protein A210_16615 [Pseudomonas putida SJTE-1]|uniref:hypothetical protein n=1 Tax=Pseudomonas putida TaxID=303 RepID=UPI00035ECDC9|nr:hypothetical protein [Pseudomonas putida]ANI04204.1 hypothetical protein A210_16615 [Pseudomonas putida SJTE-1]